MRTFDVDVYNALCEAIDKGCTVQIGDDEDVDFFDAEGLWLFHMSGKPMLINIEVKTAIIQNLQGGDKWEIL